MMGWENSVFPLLIIFSNSGGPTGEFIYSPAPGVGTLIYSATESATDPYGNKTIAGGPVAYNNSIGQAVALEGNGLSSFSGSLATGWTVGPTISFDQVNDVTDFNSPVGLVESATPSAETFAAVLFAAAASGMLQYVSDTNHGDGQVYSLGKSSKRLSGGAVTSTGTTPVTVLSATVAPGTYHVRGLVFATQGAVAATQNMAFGGTATRSNTSIGTLGLQSGGATGESPFGAVIADASAHQICIAVPAGAGFNVWFEGFITVSAAGTFTLAIADGTAGDHWSANNNSHMILEPVT